MPTKQMSLRALATAALLLHPATAVVRTTAPQLGWNSYNAYSCSPNETVRILFSFLETLWSRTSKISSMHLTEQARKVFANSNLPPFL